MPTCWNSIVSFQRFISIHICAGIYTHNQVWFTVSGVQWKRGKLVDKPLIARFMGPIWGRHCPGGPHVCPMNFAIWFKINRSIPNHKNTSNNNCSVLVIYSTTWQLDDWLTYDNASSDSEILKCWKCLIHIHTNSHLVVLFSNRILNISYIKTSNDNDEYIYVYKFRLNMIFP